jgi:hypothetical protein
MVVDDRTFEVMVKLFGCCGRSCYISDVPIGIKKTAHILPYQQAYAG